MLRHACRVLFYVLMLLVWYLPTAAQEPEYRIGSGDVLAITVYDEPDLERTCRVLNDGSIRFPLIKSLPVGGLTIREAEEAMEKALSKDYLVNPQVSIAIKEYFSQKVYVLGGVKNPGLYPLKGTTTVLEIISEAGGPLESGSRRIILARDAEHHKDEIARLLEEKGENGVAELSAQGLEPAIIIDGEKLLDEGDMTQNLLLRHGDVLFIPKLERVFVLGEVRRTGSVPYTKDLTLLQAIALAGGVTEMASNSVFIRRKVDGEEKRIKADYGEILKDADKDLLLQPNDVIVVSRRIL